MFTNKTLILCKKEVTYALDPVPTAALNAIEAKNVSITPLNAKFVDRNLMRPWFGNSGTVLVEKFCTVEFETEIAGSGTAGTAPPWGVLLIGCGCSETIVAVTSVEYSTVSAGFQSVVLWVHIDGVIHKIVGCRGTVSLSLDAGSIPTMKFKFMGLFSAPVDGAFPATPVFTAWKKPLVLDKANTAMNYFSQSINGKSLSIDLGNDLQYRNLFNQEDVLITNRNVTGKASFEMPLVATYNWIGAAVAGTTSTLTLTNGTVAGNKFMVSATDMQVSNPAYSDHLGTRFLDVDLTFMPNAGNDDITIKAF